MKIKTRILSMLAALAVLFGITPTMGFAAANPNEDYAEINFEHQENRTNIARITADYPEYVEKDGKLALQRTSGTDALYLSIKLNDCFTNEEGQPVIISVEYYDEGLGSFSIAYSGTNNIYGNGRHSVAKDIVRQEDTKQWKTHDFYIEDITFDHSYYSGDDFRIGLWTDEMGHSAGNVYIHSVKVQKVPPKSVLWGEMVSEYQGNIFGPGEDKIISVDLENRNGSELKGTVDYTVKNFYGTELIKASQDVTAAGADTTTVTFDLNEIDQFGVYTITAEYNLTGIVDGEEQTVTMSQEGEFSYANKVPDGLRNERMNAQTHGLWFGTVAAATAADWLGMGSVRDEIRWRYVEQEKGKLSIPEDNQEYVNALRGKNVNFLLELAFGNWLYDGGTASEQAVPPETEEQLDGWERYCGFVAESYKDYLKEFEVWNEYNINGFNKTGASPENYVEMTKRARRAVLEHIPDATIVGGGLAQADITYLRRILEAGVYDYVDAFSCHPYDWSGRFRNQTFVDDMREFRSAIDEYGGNKPIYLTELGLTDATMDTAGVSTEEKAAGIIQIYSLMLGENLADKWWWYDLIKSSIDETARESNWGLIKNRANETPYAATPAFVVMANMNYELTGATPNGSILYEDDTECRAYRFKTRDNKDIVTAWSALEPKNVSFNLGCDQVDVYDMYGNHIETIHGDNGIYTFTLTKEPIYIKGNMGAFEKAGNVISVEYPSYGAMAGREITIPFTDSLGRDLEIAADLSVGGFELVENNGIINGSGSVRLKSTGADGEYNVRFVLYDGETAVGTLLSKITVGKPVEIEIADFEQASAIDDSHWKSVIKIKNTTNFDTISGVCEPAEGEDPGAGVYAVKFFDLKPGEEQTLYMNLPPMEKKRNVDIEYKVTLDNEKEYYVKGTTNFQTASYAYNKPTIDGTVNLSEWTGAWVTADQPENAYSLVNGTTWGGKEDVSFDLNTMWDEENLYMAFIVEDNVFCNNEPIETMWAGDCVQFGIEDIIGTGKYIVDNVDRITTFVEMAFALLPSGPAIYRYSVIDPAIPVGPVDMSKCKLAVTRDENLTFYEIEIPWAEIFGEGYTVDPNRVYMFSTVVNDNDGSGRWGYIEYNSGIAKYKDAKLFGKLRFTK
ncbi:MAG TPA: hypothetical protein IAB04_01260 [Candidatus Avimonoglobus intestinipullorum]|uniref:Carbohydrate-binding domain-containing protein n=1 Tax=Candidatus Avimonoglobus intestinipullorum TaxID=2840699 RepID=A0A9D1LU64_9FIRM|nr:hypothetical protein [Candidatus Avimonoglobus intestinipullorum]